MKILLKIEEAAMFVLALGGYWLLDLPWWLFLLLILAPDLAALGYLAGPVVGAVTYNLTHHKAIAIALFLAGMYFSLSSGSLFFSGFAEILKLAGVIMFAHSSLDRVLGYGLKHPDSFQNTHLGRIGRTKR